MTKPNCKTCNGTRKEKCGYKDRLREPCRACTCWVCNHDKHKGEHGDCKNNCPDCTPNKLDDTEGWEAEFNEKFLKDIYDGVYPVPVESIESATLDIKKLKAFISTKVAEARKSEREECIADITQEAKAKYKALSGRGADYRWGYSTSFDSSVDALRKRNEV